MRAQEPVSVSVCRPRCHRSTVVAGTLSRSPTSAIAKEVVVESPPPAEVTPTSADLLLRAIEAIAPCRDPYDWTTELAQTVSVARPPHIRQELADNAFEYLEKAIHTYDATQPLVPWARRVLLRRQIDLYHRKRRVESLITDPGDPHRERSGEEWNEAFQTITDALAAADVYPTPSGPDHYAAVVFDFRLRVAKRIRGGDEADPAPLATVAGYLPWPKWFGPRRFTPELPRVADIWSEAERRIRLPTRTAPVAFLGECIAALVPEVPWNPVTWRKWVERGEESVKGRIPNDIWERYFQPLFIERTENSEGEQ